MQNRHKHADLIIAWANGAEIEWNHDSGWCTVTNPSWDTCTEYRIKPKEDEYQVFRDALRKGKIIQHYNDMFSKWEDINPSFLSFADIFECYRIKPEPKYVPFTWEDREQLRGKWIKHKVTGEECMITQLGKIIKPGVLSHVIKLTETWTSLSIIFDNYTFLDGSICGKFINE